MLDENRIQSRPHHVLNKVLADRFDEPDHLTPSKNQVQPFPGPPPSSEPLILLAKSLTVRLLKIGYSSLVPTEEGSCGPVSRGA
jgi:hypothetical protein